jgi:hypothetical protein
MDIHYVYIQLPGQLFSRKRLALANEHLASLITRFGLILVLPINMERSWRLLSYFL